MSLLDPGRLRLRAGYAVGDLGINLYFMTSMTFLLYFYTDVFGLSAAAASGVFLFARIVDAVTDPLMGWLADRTRTRWGKLRPWLLFGAVPMALIALATFHVPDLDATGKLVWAYATYTLFGIFYTVIGIPYSALTATLTSDHHERTNLSTWRMAFAFSGGWLVSVSLLPLVGRLGGDATAWTIAIGLYAVTATVLLWTTFASTRETVTAAVTERISLGSALAVMKDNRPLWIVMLVFSLGMLSFTVRQTVTPYFFKYNLERPDLVPLYFGVTLPMMIAVLPFIPWLAARFGKAGAVILGAWLSIASGLGMAVTPADQVEVIFVLGCLMALGGAPVAVLGWAMIPDTVEYAQWHKGVRAEGTIYAMTSFFQKLAKALGGAGAAIVLAVAGYSANAEQSDTAATAILALMTVVPAVIGVLLILVCRAYPLDADTHARIVSDLVERGDIADSAARPS